MFKNAMFAKIMYLEECADNLDSIALESLYYNQYEEYNHYLKAADKCRKQLARLRKKWANQQEDFPLVYSC